MHGLSHLHVANVDYLEDAARRYRSCSAEELVDALALYGDDSVADRESETGFFMDDVAGHASRVYAVDVQPAMHDYYREKGITHCVEFATASVEAFPFADRLDAACSTMTYPEFYSEDALVAVAHALHGDGRLVPLDWSADGDGDSGPPLDERVDLATVWGHLERHGFIVDRADDRPETWVVVVRPGDVADPQRFRD